MADQLIPIAKFNEFFNQYLPQPLNHNLIYQSKGLAKHIAKRHPECLSYLNCISFIIDAPDYIGVNPHETNTSFELIKVMAENVLVGIKLDMKNNYLYVATLHTITYGKLQHGIASGRLKKFDNSEYFPYNKDTIE